MATERSSLPIRLLTRRIQRTALRRNRLKEGDLAAMLDSCYWLFDTTYWEYGEEEMERQAAALAKALDLPFELVMEHYKPICCQSYEKRKQPL